ncbi:Hypothetical protein DHA2_17524 [Giardia duodenalis]|uniref:Hikeshi-like domain-containing protein n=1 Tax=Giardia intestinalis TaxID=5741 RepID=V6TDP4_GIAIN|nr:Hypothetical protein DHA2_17524 [Giardia intestinalis]
MFGCVVCHLGYSDQFQQTAEGNYVLSFPNSFGLGNISVFTFTPASLTSCAVEVAVSADGFYEKIGYLTEYSPSITFVTGLERLNKAELSFSLCLTLVPLESVDQNLPYQPTDYELTLLNRATIKMVDHFKRYLAPSIVTHGGQEYISLKRVMTWKDTFLKESKALGAFWD